MHPDRSTTPSTRRTIAATTLTVLAGLMPVATAAASAPPDAPPSATTGGNPAGCVADWDGTPLFTDQFTVDHADNYSIEYHDNYKVLTVVEPYFGADPEHYVLVQCGTDAPDLDGELAGAQVVDIPIESMYSTSSSHLGFIDVLGIADTVTGVSNADTVMIDSVRSRVDAGEVVSFAPTFEVDAEVVINGAPDVLVGGGSDDPAHEAIVAAGIPVLGNAEWMETTPQGWAEWVGFFAALTNTEATANDLMAEWTADYDAAAELVADVAERPTVLTGELYDGAWFARGGQNLVARFIADAGGDYLYADTDETGTLSLDIETVLVDGGDADVWLTTNGGFFTRDEALAIDERYGQFAAWDAGGVWTNVAAVDPAVSTLEVGPTRIADYLLDYVKIFHPDVAGDHEFVFFEAVTS